MFFLEVISSACSKACKLQTYYHTKNLIFMKNQFVSFKTIVRAGLIIILYASCASAVQAQNYAMKFTLGTSDYLKLGGEKVINPYMSAVVNMNFYDKSYRSNSLFLVQYSI